MLKGRTIKIENIDGITTLTIEIIRPESPCPVDSQDYGGEDSVLFTEAKSCYEMAKKDYENFKKEEENLHLGLISLNQSGEKSK